MGKGIKKKIIFILAACFLVAGIYIAITHMEKSSEETESASATQWVDLKVNDFDYTLDFYSNGQFINVGTLNSDAYNTFTFGSFSGYSVMVNGTEVHTNEPIQIKLDKLSKETPVRIEIYDTAKKENREYYINTLPENYSDPVIFSNHPEEGFYYFNLNEYVYKMNTNGDVVFWRLAGRGDISSGGDDFKRTEADGKVYYSFLYGNESVDSYFLNGVGYGRMQALVLNENYEIVDNVGFLTMKDGTKTPLENHQFTVLGEKHYLLTSYVGKRVNNIPDSVEHSTWETRVVAAVIQEIKDGEILFEWDSTKHPELYALSSTGNDYYNTEAFWADYAHLNSVVVDPSDQNLICSFRNLDTVMKIQRTTGEIIWKLGGIGDEFGLSEDQLFSKQHDARITQEGTITIFNNGNDGNSFLDGKTSIIEFELDENTKQLKKCTVYDLQNQFSSHMGSAQKDENTCFTIGWGGRQTYSPLFSEVNLKTGEVLFEVISNRDSGPYPDVYKVYKFSR